MSAAPNPPATVAPLPVPQVGPGPVIAPKANKPTARIRDVAKSGTPSTRAGDQYARGREDGLSSAAQDYRLEQQRRDRELLDRDDPSRRQTSGDDRGNYQTDNSDDNNDAYADPTDPSVDDTAGIDDGVDPAVDDPDYLDPDAPPVDEDPNADDYRR